MATTAVFEPRPHCWEASALTIAPTLLPQYTLYLKRHILAAWYSRNPEIKGDRGATDDILHSRLCLKLQFIILKFVYLTVLFWGSS